MAKEKARSFRPKEHGAYGQLALPLIAALAMGRPGAASACLVCASIALFVAHEPLLVLAGVRGQWAKREHGARALRSGVAWTGIGVASGLGGLWLGGESVVRGAVLPVSLLLILTPIVLRGAEKTLGGEVVAALALAAAAMPVAIAGGLSIQEAVVVWAAWSVAFTASTSAVHWVVSAHRDRRHLPSLWLTAVTIAAAILLLTQTRLAFSAMPMLLLSCGLMLRPPHARHLRRVGWALAVSGALNATLAVALGGAPIFSSS